jgi:HlyD family secretion protein
MPTALLQTRSGKGALVVLLAIAFGFLAGLGGAAVFRRFDHPTTSNTFSGETSSPLSENAIIALGRLEPVQGVISVLGPVGDRIDEICVDDDDVVDKDDLLVLLASRRDRQKEVDLLAQQCKEAQGQIDAITASAKAEERVLDAQLRQLEETSAVEKTAQDRKVTGLKMQYESASHVLEDMKNNKDMIYGKRIELQKLLVEQAKLEWENARDLLDQMPNALKLKKEALDEQRNSLKSSTQRALGQVPLESLKIRQQQAELLYEHATLRAPVAGRVLEIFARPGDPTTGQPILELADTKQMMVVAEVNQNDVEKLRLWKQEDKDHKVEIKVIAQALKDSPNTQDLTGTLGHIGRVVARNKIASLDPTAPSDRRVFEVKIFLDNPAPVEQLVHMQVEVVLKRNP